jgi:hypothetical protein
MAKSQMLFMETKPKLPFLAVVPVSVGAHNLSERVRDNPFLLGPRYAKLAIGSFQRDEGCLYTNSSQACT